MKEIVLASNNSHKLLELRDLLKETGIRLLSLSDIGFRDEIIEDGSSFYENAYIKACTDHDFSGKPCLADDSGLEVRALNGKPGIHSARFAGDGANDQDNTNKLLERLEGIQNRRANFVAVLCFISDRDYPEYFEGKCHGNISDSPKGSQGFGYDPVFIPDGYQSTFGEMGSAAKAKISHRAIAMNLFRDHLLRLKDED